MLESITLYIKALLYTILENSTLYNTKRWHLILSQKKIPRIILENVILYYNILVDNDLIKKILVDVSLTNDISKYQLCKRY